MTLKGAFVVFLRLLNIYLMDTKLNGIILKLHLGSWEKKLFPLENKLSKNYFLTKSLASFIFIFVPWEVCHYRSSHWEVYHFGSLHWGACNALFSLRYILWEFEIFKK